MPGSRKHNKGKKESKQAPVVSPTTTKPVKQVSKKKQQATIPKQCIDVLNRRSEPSTTDMILRSVAGGTASNKEVFMTMTDYFDIGTAATPYWFWSYETSQEVFTSGTPSTDPFVKLISASIYALAKFDAASSATASIMVLTTTPSFPGSQNADGVAANPRTTVLTPNPNTKWVLCGKYKSSKLFTGGLVPQVSNAGNQIVFAGTLLDPDTMEKFTTDTPVQMKIVCKFAVGLDPITRFKYAFSENDVASTLAFPVSVSTTAQPIVMQVTGMGDIA